MDIFFETKKFEKMCNDSKALRKAYGADQAGRIRARLDDLHAAETLHEVLSLPHHRLHRLGGDLDGLLSIDLKHPYRLLIEVAGNPPPSDWTKVTAIRVVRIEDTHG